VDKIWCGSHQFPCENPICCWLNVRCHVEVLAYLNLICFNAKSSF
jgi:hypothetical protein